MGSPQGGSMQSWGGGWEPAGPGARADVDPVEAYFECITTCSLDDGECVTVCTNILRDQA